MSSAPFRAFITNAGKYAEGDLIGEWVSFPTTPEKIQAVFARIGIDGKRYEEIRMTAYESGIDGLNEYLNEFASLDELNYLASRIDDMDSLDIEKFKAALAYGEYTSTTADLINITHNLDSYELFPNIDSERELGEYQAELDQEAYQHTLDELSKSYDTSMRSFAKYVDTLQTYIDAESYGTTISINESSRFTQYGYVRVYWDSFTKEYDGTEIPEEYRLNPYPIRPPEPEKSHPMPPVKAPKKRTAPAYGAR